MNGKNEIMAILGKARGFWEARVLMTAAELDIFSYVLDSPRTAAQISAEMSSDQRGTEALLNALAAQGLLVKKDGAFQVRSGFERALSSSSPETVLPMIQHMAQLWETWGKLTDIVVKGKKTASVEALERDEKGIRAFIGAMHTIGRGMAGSVMEKLDLSDRKALIDVGGGSGVYTIAALRAAPQMRATIFDLPPVIEIAREKIGEENLLERVTFVKGDYHKDTLPGGHDIALLSAIIHSNSSEQNIRLYGKIFDALVPGGVIVVRDYVMSDDHTGPPDGAMFAINMLVNTPGGGTYSFAETGSDLEAAGFSEVTLMHRGEMDSLVTAKKRA